MFPAKTCCNDALYWILLYSSDCQFDNPILVLKLDDGRVRAGQNGHQMSWDHFLHCFFLIKEKQFLV